MELRRVDFETAKRLFNIGFPIEYDDGIYCLNDCISAEGDYLNYHQEGDLILYPEGFSLKDVISAPTLELVNKWLIENKGIVVETVPCFKLEGDTITFEKWTYKIHNLNEVSYSKFIKESVNSQSKNKEYFDDRELALECGIKKTLEMF